MKKIIIIPWIGALALCASIAYAGPAVNPIVNCSENAICNPLKSASVTGVLQLIVSVAVPVGATLAVLAFIFVGFKFIAAQGKPEKINEAWAWFKYIAIGTAILIGASAIIAIVTATLNSTGLVQPGVLPSS